MAHLCVFLPDYSDFEGFKSLEDLENLFGACSEEALIESLSKLHGKKPSISEFEAAKQQAHQDIRAETTYDEELEKQEKVEIRRKKREAEKNLIESRKRFREARRNYRRVTNGLTLLELDEQLRQLEFKVAVKQRQLRMARQADDLMHAAADQVAINQQLVEQLNFMLQ